MARIFQDLLDKGELIRVFSAGRLLHPVLLEMFRCSGMYHGLWLDQEHAGLTTEQVTTAALVARGAGLGCFVRMPFTHYSLVSQNLESGVDGVMAARIDSAAEAAEFVRWCKFAPQGMRGMNTAGADALYTFRSLRDLAEVANREHFIAVQIETPRALDECDAIAALDGVDLLFVGPADLSQELGVLGQPDHPRVLEAIDRVAAACRRHGKHWGTVSFSPAFARQCVDRGCRLLTLGGDCHALRMGLEKLREAYREFL